MKKIVAFIYPFEKAEQIIDYSIRLAKDLDCELELVHAVEPTHTKLAAGATIKQTPVVIPEQIQTELIQERERIIEKVLSVKKASIDFSVPVSVTVISSSLSKLFNEVSQNNNVEMLVVPNSKSNDDALMASDLVDSIQHPVFVMPTDQTYQVLRTITYATDYNDKDIEVLKKLSEIAIKMNSSITVYNATQNKEYEDELKKKGFQDMVQQKVGFGRIMVFQEETKKISKGIKDFSEKFHADLLVLVKKDKNFLQELFGGSTVKHVIKDVQIPVLVYPS